jgi:signal transduction histidine kinase
MMHEFLANNRSQLIERCKAKMGARPAREATYQQLNNGVPIFLNQLIKTLCVEQTSQPSDSQKISGPAIGSRSSSEVGTSAALHGRELFSLGYSIDQVVHDYGDMCQAITDLAYERDAPFQIDEFRTLNRCLDNAIADSVTEFSYQRDTAATLARELEANQEAGFFAHELRNALGIAKLAFTAAKTGNLSLLGATGSLLERSLSALSDLIDHSLAEVRAKAGATVSSQLFSMAEFIVEVEVAASLAARVRGCTLVVSEVDDELAVSGDRNLLYAALGNLLQNAFKFTRSHSEVTLSAYAHGDRILIDVTDHCGGLAAGDVEVMFKPFKQSGPDKSGLGLGLVIARRSVEAFDGLLTVANVPGSGCVFTISLPRYLLTDSKGTRV